MSENYDQTIIKILPELVNIFGQTIKSAQDRVNEWQLVRERNLGCVECGHVVRSQCDPGTAGHRPSHHTPHSALLMPAKNFMYLK